MKRLLCALCLLTLLAAACGSDDTSTVAGGGDETPTDDGSAEPPAEEPTPDPYAPIGGSFPIADLTITYEHPDAGTFDYRIVCLGDTATLIPPDVDGVEDQAACEALSDDEVRTRLIDGVPTDLVCTEIYGGPDTAHIVGTIDESPVDTTVDRVNGCGIDDWDRLLVALLPPPQPFT